MAASALAQAKPATSEQSWAYLGTRLLLQQTFYCVSWPHRECAMELPGFLGIPQASLYLKAWV